VDRGLIWMSDLPMYPGETLEGCSKLRCSSISVEGVDVAALEARAAQLGYADTTLRQGDRRGPPGDLHAPPHSFCDSYPAAQPWGVAFSGGGWRAQAAAFGFGKALYKSRTLPQVDTIASVSGGSWANLQMAFSERFFAGVEGTHEAQDLSVSQQDEAGCLETCQFYRQWMETYYRVQSPAEARANGNAMTAAVSEFVEMLSPKYAEMLIWVVGNNFNWEEFITDMINAYTPGIAERAATAGNRQGQQHTDLLICTSLPSVSQLSGDDGLTTVGGKTHPGPVMPVGFIVPGRNRGSQGEKWWSPQQQLNDLQVKTHSYWWWDSTEKLTAGLPSPISVGKATAMSSAAVGFLSSPPMTTNYAESSASVGQGDVAAALGLGDLGGYAASSVAYEAGLQDLGVCTGPDMHNCEFPSVRLMDGGITDDSAIALLVAKLQRAWPDQTLRVAALNSDECLPPKNGAPKDCRAGSAYNFATLFEGETPKILVGWETGKAWMGGKVFMDTINTTIFESMSENTIGQEIPDGYGMTYTLTTLLTTDAPKWGIKAGSKVEILELHINSLLGDQPLGLKENQNSVQGPEDTTAFGLLAQHVEEVLTRTDALKNFFDAGPSGVKFQ